MDFQTDLKKKDDGSFVINVTIPAEEIKKIYHQVIEEQAKEAEIKGFRKGKAPVNLVEEKIGKEKLDNQLLNKVINQSYPEAIKKLDLKPIIPPEVKLVSTEKNKEWEIKFISTELPEVDLGEFKEKIKEINAQSGIWTPETEGKKEVDDQEKKDQKIQKVIETLLKNVKVDLPEILINQELNRKLVNLIDQVNQTGLKLEDYLSTKGTNIEEIKKDFRQQIINNWKIDLALEKIADQEEVEVTEEDTKKIEESKLNPYIAAKIIRRQKTLEYLSNL